MPRSLRIIAADDEPSIQEYYRQTLPALGHEVVAVVDSSQALIEECRAQRPDLVIADINMPDMDGIAAAAKIYEEQPVPILLVTGVYDPETIKRATAEHILAYLVKPVKKASLEAEIAIAMRRFEEFQVLRMETEHYRKTLQDRKLIERAKGILMTKMKMDEESAFKRLQTLASEKNRKIVDIAQTIIATEETFSSR